MGLLSEWARTERKLNALAREFYRMMGYVVEEGYDFSEATHPQERMCWAMACKAFEIIKEIK